MPRTGRDITGERFGKLVVTGSAGYGRAGRQRVALWYCRCDCGNTCKVEGYLLKSGRRKSCGCIRSTAEEMIGKRYGKLTVVAEDLDNHTTLQKVICRCDCGKEKSIATRDLKNGKMTDCGCGRARPGRGDCLERQYDPALEVKREAFQKGDASGIITLEDWVYVWLRSILPHVVKGTTIRMYAETMERHVLPALGPCRLEELTEEKVSGWINGLGDMPLSGTRNGRMTEGTVRNTLSVLSGCMRDAQKSGLVEKNPCTEPSWTLRSKNVWEEQEWLSEDQVRMLEPLLAAYRDEGGYPLGIGFGLVLYTGITLSEAAALRWRDVDLEGKKLRLEYFVSIKREAGTAGAEERHYELERLSGRKRREVPLPDFLAGQLGQIKKEYQGEPDGFVLGGSGRRPVRIDRMRAVLMRRGHACGIGTVTPRMLRDTYAVRAVRAGASSDMVAELMGFASSQQVIRRYMPRSVADKSELIKKMFG